jgi:hypothetical protein
MLKYSIEVQDTDGQYVEVADRTRRFADALTALECLTGEGTYRITFGRFVKTEKVVEPQGQTFGRFAVGAQVRFGARGKVVWEVFRTGENVVSLINPDTNARKFDVPVSKLVLASEAAAPKAA